MLVRRLIFTLEFLFSSKFTEQVVHPFGTNEYLHHMNIVEVAATIIPVTCIFQLAEVDINIINSYLKAFQFKLIVITAVPHIGSKKSVLRFIFLQRTKIFHM